MDRITNSNNINGESSEEGTTFRSVPLQQTLQRPAVLPPLKAAPFGKLPALSSLPSSKKSPASSVVAPAAAGPVPTWNVSSSELPSVPTDYPLERTALPLQGKLEGICSSIMTVLHSQGVICSFPSSENDNDDDMDVDTTVRKGRVNCTSAHGELKFVLQLYKSKSSSSDDEFIVEVQRRAGSSIELHGVRRPLFQTLLGQRTTSSAVPPRAMALDASKRRFPLPLRC